MTRLEEFCKRMEQDKVIQLSGGVFRDHVRPDGIEIKANITPENYCIGMAKLSGCDTEVYADEILNMLDGPMQKIVGECPYCYAFLIAGEIHNNCQDVTYKIPAMKCHECGCDGKNNEVINYAGEYLCNECAKHTGNTEL